MSRGVGDDDLIAKLRVASCFSSDENSDLEFLEELLELSPLWIEFDLAARCMSKEIVFLVYNLFTISSGEVTSYFILDGGGTLGAGGGFGFNNA